MLRGILFGIRPNQVLTRASISLKSSTHKMSTLDEPKEFKIPIPSGHIAGKVWNEGGRPLLGLHGWMDNAGTWDGIAPLLPPDVSLVSIDFGNHGLSSPRPYGASNHFFDLIVEIERVVKHFNWDQIDILGHSMGGGAGMVYAATFPHKVRKLIMVDLIKPVSVEPDNQPQRTAKSVIELLQAEAKLTTSPPSYDYETILQRIIKSYGYSLTEEAAKTLLKRGAKQLENGQYSFSHDPRVKVGSIISLSFEQQKAYARQLKCDMLIIKAKNGPLYENKEIYNEILTIYEKQAKTFSFAKVEGTHHVHMNQPELVAPIICEFIQNEDMSVECVPKL